jgi:AbrB family looped-hinge helix DNA binding protein
METVKVSSKGQIVIPKSLRDSCHIRTGDTFVVSQVGGELRLRPATALRQSSLESVAGMLHRPGRQKLSNADIERAIGHELLADDMATKSE